MCAAAQTSGDIILFTPSFFPPKGGNMSDINWQALYTAALSESDPNRLYGKVEAARRAIRQRLEQLDGTETSREREQLDRAMHALFTLSARRRSA
jgi:hypothetical protein